MFSTLLYIVINIYQSLFSVSNFSYNSQIEKFNFLVEQKEFSKAKILIDELRLNSIFYNKEIENRYQLISLKLADGQKINAYTSESEADIIITSFLNSKYLHTRQINTVLSNAIIDHPNSDSLVYVYELLKSQKIIRKNNPTYVSYRSQNFKWNEAEALQLLDMMKKNEKLLL